MHKTHEERVNLQIKLDIAINTLEDIANGMLCSEKHYLGIDINKTLKELK